jgi:general L-amino acid transport system substrate-binding protein
MMRTLLPLLLGLALLAPAALADQVQAIQRRGTLNCGVNGGLPGFSAPDERDVMRGLDADLCRAVAAAILGDGTRVNFLPQPSPGAGFGALGEGNIDLLARNTTWTFLRETTQGVTAAGIALLDGQGLLVPAASPATAFAYLADRRICVADRAGLETDDVVLAEAERLGIRVELVETGPGLALLAGLAAGRCDAATADYYQLAIRRVTEMADPAAWRLLPGLLSREPLALFVRTGDERLREVVFWTVEALKEAEELGVTRDNLVDQVQANDPAVRRLVGIEPGLGSAMSLEEGWSQSAIAAVGNYGEIFERNLGAGSPFGLDRGLNHNWQRGGLVFPLPLR